MVFIPFSESKELKNRLDEVILRNKEQVDSLKFNEEKLNEEIDVLKEQNQLLHDQIESLVETAEMKDEANIANGIEAPDTPEKLNYPEHEESEDDDLEGASQGENNNDSTNEDGTDDEDYDAEETFQIDPATGEKIETDNPYDQEDEIHEVDSVEDGLPEDEAEDYNDGGNIGDDDHDNEDVVDEGIEYDTESIDNDQTNDEHYQTNDELNNEINYQLEGYEPDSKSGKFVIANLSE